MGAQVIEAVGVDSAQLAQAVAELVGGIEARALCGCELPSMVTAWQGNLFGAWVPSETRCISCGTVMIVWDASVLTVDGGVPARVRCRW